MSTEILLYFLVPLFFVAFLYSSIGHGGASGYLALMALFSMSPEVMKPTALLLNIFVSLISFVHYYKGGYFRLSIFLPVALASIPMAFLGGIMDIETYLYKAILGVFLLFPILRFLLTIKKNAFEEKKNDIFLSILIGGGIGFFSGLIGIGGGIILSPVLLLLRWCNIKQAAAISALFIFVNSSSGILGQMIKGVQFSSEMYIFVLVAFIGGYLGAYFGAKKFTLGILKFLLAFVLLLASYKLLFLSSLNDSL